MKVKEKNLDKLEKRWEDLVSVMDLPEQRKVCNDQNVRWFLRNGAINNRFHKNVSEAIDIAKRLI